MNESNHSTTKDEVKTYLYNVAYALQVPIDEKGDLLPNAFDLTDHYEKKRHETKKRIEELQKQGIPFAETCIEQERQYAKEQYAKCQLKIKENEHLLRDIRQWNPPSTQAQTVKAKAIRRLEASIESNVMSAEHYHPSQFAHIDPKEWLEKEIQSQGEYLDFYNQEYERHIHNQKDLTQLVHTLQADIELFE